MDYNQNENGERFWAFQQDQSDSIVPLPYGNPTWTVVDENQGGIIAYVNHENVAHILINALIHQED